MPERTERETARQPDEGRGTVVWNRMGDLRNKEPCQPRGDAGGEKALAIVAEKRRPRQAGPSGQSPRSSRAMSPFWISLVPS